MVNNNKSGRSSLTNEVWLRLSRGTNELVGRLRNISLKSSVWQTFLPKIRYLESDVRYPESGIRYPESNVRYHESDVRYPVF